MSRKSKVPTLAQMRAAYSSGRTPAQKAAAKRMLAAAKVKRLTKKRSEGKRVVAKVKARHDKFGIALRDRFNVFTSKNGGGWRHVATFRSVADAKEYAVALGRKTKDMVRVDDSK